MLKKEIARMDVSENGLLLKQLPCNGKMTMINHQTLGYVFKRKTLNKKITRNNKDSEIVSTAASLVDFDPSGHSFVFRRAFSRALPQ